MGDLAKLLLESTRMSMEAITSAVGYEESNSFRRLFQERIGLAPSADRKRFQRGAPTASAEPD
ncbi:MAG: helix-turn-helix domain-containing protein [Aquabacterium sp.]